MLSAAPAITLEKLPPKGHGRQFKFYSSDPGVATFDNEGKVTGNFPGTATITVVSINGITDTVTVKVAPGDPML